MLFNFQHQLIFSQSLKLPCHDSTVQNMINQEKCHIYTMETLCCISVPACGLTAEPTELHGRIPEVALAASNKHSFNQLFKKWAGGGMVQKKKKKKEEE